MVFKLPIGAQFIHKDRKLRYTGMADDEIVNIIDVRTGGPVQILDEKTGQRMSATLPWMLQEFKEGILRPLAPPLGQSTDERHRCFAALDPDACEDRDQRSTWRFGLAFRAAAANIPKTDQAYEIWLDENYGHADGDLKFPRPSGSSLRRWIRYLEKRGKRTSSVVSLAGRKKGFSQLEPEVDCAVHAAAIWYWATPGVTKAAAYAHLQDLIDALNAGLPTAARRITPYKMPSKEALRKRINKLYCRETYTQKHGKADGDRRFKESGEPLRADRILELAYMDTTQLEQVIVFDEDWQLPACKVWITAIMDVRSKAIIGFVLFAGPRRSETSIECLIDAMTPGDVPPEKAARHPILAYMFGKPAAILPDNELALLGPSMVPALNEAGIDLLLPPVSMPTAKAALERFFRTLKKALEQVPGTMIDPKRAKDLGYEAIGNACLTLAQLRTIVRAVIADYHILPHKGLGGKCPAQVWEADAEAVGGASFEDFGQLRRLLGRTKTALLTTDGIEFQRIRYKPISGDTSLLDDLARNTPVRSRRRDGSATVEVSVRYSPGNVDILYVYNPLSGDFAEFLSTQPEYTDGLSEWEHDEFTRQARRRNEKFCSKEDRLRSVAQTLRLIDELAPQTAFQGRKAMAGLYISRQIKRLSGEACLALPAPGADGFGPAIPQSTAEGLRQDLPTPPKVPKSASRIPAKHLPPARPEGYGGQPYGAPEVDWGAVPADVAAADPEAGCLLDLEPDALSGEEVL
ncbi:MAG TPA: integrase [Allosphingosinicella sp.]